EGTGREADFRGELGEVQRGERRGGVRLEHDGASGRQRGRQLPGRHHQWVVPGDDLRRDADGLLQRVEEERTAERVRTAGDRRDRGRIEAEVLDALIQLRLDGGDRLADVANLELREFFPVGHHRV